MWPFKIKSKEKEPSQKRVQLIVSQNGTSAIFGDYGDDVLTNDTAIQSIAAIAREVKKLNPKHVKFNGKGYTVVDDSITRMLRRPNKGMTTSDFLEAIIWRLYGKDNCFIYPKYELKQDANGYLKRIYTEMYILQPQLTEFYVDDNDTVLQVKFTFANGTYLMINYQSIIHIKRNFGLNELMGGDKFGRPNNDAMIKTIKISEALLEGVNKGAEASQSVVGAMKYNVLLDDGEMKKNIETFNENLKSNKSGIIGLDLAGEYIPISRDVKLVDAETIEYVDKKITRNYGVSIPIIDAIASSDEKKAFYDTTLEPLVISFNQAFTNCLFTDGEISRGNEIKFYYNIMETYSNEEKFEHGKELMDRGGMTINEFRDLLGYPPMENGDITKPSLNYVDGDIARDYQLGKAGMNKQTEKEGEQNEDES